MLRSPMSAVAGGDLVELAYGGQTWTCTNPNQF
jgi:hypothetical protein